MVKRSTSHGFTVVELLIVIVIIAILAVLTIVAFNGMQQRAKESLVKSSLSSANKKLQVYNIENGAYPTLLSNASVTDSSQVTYQYRVDAALGYCVTATAGNVSMYSSGTNQQAASGACAGHGANGAQPVTNFALNPGLEGGVTSGWAYGTISTSIVKTGTRSIMFTGAATPTDTAIYLDNVSVPSAGTYYVSADIYLTGNGASYGNRDGMWSVGPWVMVSYNRSLVNQWQRIQATGTTTGATNLQLRFYPPAGASIYVDNVMIANAASGYADGSTSGWMWNGAANASTSTGSAQ